MEIQKGMIRVAWVHNFSRNLYTSSGIWMFTLYDVIKEKASHVKVDLIDIGSIDNPFVLLNKVIKYRKRFKSYDILHAQYGSGTGFFTSLFPNKKIISLRGSDWHYFSSSYFPERLHSWLSCFLSRRSMSKFEYIVVMSERMKREIESRFSSLEVKVIPDGIDLNKFYPAGKKGMPFRILFSSVDRKNRIKRFYLAEAAFKIFHSKHPDSELVFMHGISHDKVNELINSVNVILLTSVHEGWPNIIKEGLACNVPFVSTDVSDLRDIAQKTNSCVICRDDPESLATGLESVYLLKKEVNIRYLAMSFDIQATTCKLADLYLALMIKEEKSLQK